MIFARPGWLWLLLLIAPLLLLELRRPRPAHTRVRSVVLAASRVAGLACMIVALAQPILERVESLHTRVAVVDMSASISDADLEAIQARLEALARPVKGESFRLVVFDRMAREVAVKEGEAAPNLLGIRRRTAVCEPGQSQSSIADALMLGGALIRGDRGRVVLFSDGLETRGSARTAAYRLARRGIATECVVTGDLHGSDVVLRSISLPPAADLGATVELRLEIESSEPRPARLVVRSPGCPDIVRTLDLEAGRHVLTERVLCDEPGLRTYTAEIVGQGDTNELNNELSACILIAPARRVVVVEDAAGAPASAALSAMLGRSVEVESRSPTELASSVDWPSCDLLVIADVPAGAMPSEAWQRIADSVVAGMGLLATGGQRAFGPGGFSGSPLAGVLPVRFAQEVERRDPSTTLVVIIDTSGSMGGPRISLAKEIARLALTALSPHDKAGIVEFYGSKRWAAPIQPASNTIDLHRALNRLSASGGTVILPAIEEAYYALQNVQTRTRHVLVLTDGGVETGAFEPLIRKMADSGIVLSTVMVGPGAHSSFLATLAQWGRGRFYAAPDRFNLPEVIVKQPETSPLSPWVEQPLALRAGEDTPLLSDIDVSFAPPLGGYVKTELRPTADLLIASEQGDPVLARWRYGLGAVAVFSSQLGGEWSAQFANWPEASQVFARVARSLYGVRRSQALSIQATHHAGATVFDIRDVLADAQDASAPVELVVTHESGQVSRWTVDPVLPHRWNHRVTGLRPGACTIAARTPDDRKQGMAGFHIPLDRERYTVAPDRELLDAVAAMHGRFGAVEVSSSSRRSVELWLPLVAGALVLLLVHVLVRRWPLERWWPSRAVTRVGAAVLLVTMLSASPRAFAEARTGPGLLEQARQMERQGNDVAAMDALARALQDGLEGADRSEAMLRLAMLGYANSQADNAASLLSDLARASSPAVRGQAGHVAALCGDDATAAALLEPMAKTQPSLHLHLFCGLYSQRSGSFDAAREEYEKALALAGSDRDRRFAIERIITAARGGGQLQALADKWLTDDAPPADQVTALVVVLRELGRAPEALDAIDLAAQGAAGGALLDSPALQREAIAAALASGDLAQAEAVYLQLIGRQPGRIDLVGHLGRLYLADEKREQAEQLLRTVAARAQDGGVLFALADQARSLSLDAVALDAARKAGLAGPVEAARAAQFEAGLLQQRGRPDAARQLLREATDAGGDDLHAMQVIAETLERLGDKAGSLALYRRVHEAARSEDVLLKLAWLLEENRELETASELWKQLWETTQVPARQRQAAERMLDLFAKTGRMADLAIEMEERVQKGDAGDRELSLLIDIYTTANDPVSVAEILHEFADRSGREVEALNRLARAYLSCEQFGQCHAVLDRLIVLDPENAADYLQQIAILAVERKRPHEARQALARLDAMGSETSMADEIAAGVLELLGLHEEAAERYTRILSAHPSRIESLLLWGNAMKASGQGEAALERFQEIIETAVDDDLFTVAVDGLLNLQAPPAVLRWAVRRINARIAASPEKVFLYQLAGDVLDAFNQKAQAGRMLEQAVIVAGERRGPLLRELMDMAREAGKVDAQIAFGRSVMLLGDELPPQVFLDLGEALVKQGELASAEQVFERAGVEADQADVRTKMALCYEDAGLPAEAERIVRQLLAIDPENLPLLMRCGALNEQLGRFDDAFEDYGQAVELLLRRQPGRTDAPSSGPQDVSAGKAPRRPGGATNVDEMAQLYEPAVEGMLGSARTPAQRQQLIAEASARVTMELAALRETGPPAARIADHPRLDRLARTLRRVAIALHEPDRADEIDRVLLEAFPQDMQLRLQVVQARLDWGLDRRARALADRPEVVALRPGLQVEELLAHPDQIGADAGAEIPPEAAARLATILVLAGRDQEFRQVVNRMRPPDGEDLPATLVPLMTAAAAMGDAGLVEQTFDTLLIASGRIADDKKMVANLDLLVRRARRDMDQARAGLLLERIGQMAGRLPDKNRLAVEMFRHQWAVQMGLPFADADKLVRVAGEEESLSTDALARLLADALERMPVTEQSALVREVVASRKPAVQRTFLLGLVNALRFAPDPDLGDTIVSLFQAAPPPRLQSGQLYNWLAHANWARNWRAPKLVLGIADYLLSLAPQDVSVLVITAVARANAGLFEEAASLAIQAFDSLIAIPSVEAQHRRIVDDLCSALLTPALEEIAADLLLREEIEGATPTSMFVRGVVAWAADRRAEAIEAFRTAFEASPGNRMILRAMITSMRDEGRLAELADVLSANLTSSSMMESYEWRALSEVYYDLNDPAAAMKAARRDASPLSPVLRMRAARLMDDQDELLVTVRQFMCRSRESGRIFTPFWGAENPPGGMREYLARQEAIVSERSRLYEAIADSPFAWDEYSAALVGARPDRSDVPGLVRGLACAVALRGEQRLVLERLAELQRRDALTTIDRRLFLALLRDSDVQTGPGELLIPLIEDALRHADLAGAEELKCLARTLEQVGRKADAQMVMRWVQASQGDEPASPSEPADARQLASRLRNPHFDENIGAIRLCRRMAAFEGQVNAMTLLPRRVPETEALTLGRRLASVLDDGVTRGYLRASAGVRSLALLAAWYAEQGLPDEAGSVLTRAREIAGEPGSHWLWLADAARLLGDETLARELENELHQARMLPLVRLSWAQAPAPDSARSTVPAGSQPASLPASP